MAENATSNGCELVYKGRRVFRPGRGCATGFDHNYTPVKILGLDPGDVNNPGFTFLVEWKEVDFLELIPREIANEKIPQLVIEFFHSRFVFKSF